MHIFRPMIRILSEEDSIANRYLFEMRHKTIQQDSMRFRLNVERIGEIMAYEISRTLTYKEVSVETPLGVAETRLISDQVVIGSILRAGVPFHQGFLRIFDGAGNAFFSAYRKHHKDGSFEIKMEYMTCPSLDDKVLILVDPMLATGASTARVLKELQKVGNPGTIHLATIIASRYGMDYLVRNFPQLQLWAVAVDEELTAKSYIVPGLGDAGDLMFGPKLQE